MALPANIPTGSATVVIAATFTGAAGYGYSVATGEKTSQAFTGLTCVSSITISLSKFGSPTDGSFIEIRSGSENGTLLGKSNVIAATDISSSAGTETFTFSPSIGGLNSSDTYYAVIQRSGALSTSHYYNFHYNTTNPYAFSDWKSLANGVWVTGSTGYDICMSVIGNGLSTAMACVGPFKASKRTIIFAPNVVGGSSTNVGTTANHAAAQSFTPTANLACSFARLYLSKNASPTDNLILTIRSGSQTGTVIATSDPVDTTPLIAFTNIVTFTFSSPGTLVAGTRYWFVLTRSGAYNDTNYMTVRGATSSAVPDETASTANSSDVWVTSSFDWSLAYGSNEDAFYFFGKDAANATILRCYRADDPTGSWGALNLNGGTGGDLQALSAVQVGDTIHLAMITGTGTSVGASYRTFDILFEYFNVTENVASAFNPQTSAAAAVYACSICMQNSQPTVLYNGPQVANMGSSYSRIYEKHRTGDNVWSAGQLVDAGGTIDYTAADIVAGSSNRAHAFYLDAVASPSTRHRTITSAYGFGTEASASGNQSPGWIRAISYDVSGTVKVRATTDPFSGEYKAFDSADSPTLTALPLIGVPNSPKDLFYDSGAQTLWTLGRTGSDDISIASSTDHGTAWSSATISLVGTVSSTNTLSIDGNIYQRGTSVVIPYIVNDNGTLKYNEYVARTVYPDAWNVADKSAGLTLSNNDKTVTYGSAGGYLRSTTANARSSGNKYYAEFNIDNYVSSVNPAVGLKDVAAGLTDSVNLVRLNSNGGLYIEGSFVTTILGQFADNDIISFAWDTALQKVWFRQNAGSWAFGDPAAGSGGYSVSSLESGNYCLWCQIGVAAEAVTLRTETAEFTIGSYPAGFLSWMGEALEAPPALPIENYVKHAGVWKKPTATHVKQGGTWKLATATYVKHAGIWKQMT